MADRAETFPPAVNAEISRCADLVATMLADLAKEREDLRSLRTLAWCVALTFGAIALSIWAWGSWRSSWEGPAWMAGIFFVGGLLCDGAAGLVERLRWRLEHKVTGAGMTVQWRDADSVRLTRPIVWPIGEKERQR